MEAASQLAAVGVPSPVWTVPFVALLLCVAVLPLLRSTQHWWHDNFNKLLVSLVVAGAVLVHYATRQYGVHLHSDAATDLMRLLGFKLLPDGPGFITAGGSDAAVTRGLRNRRAAPRSRWWNGRRSHTGSRSINASW